MTGIYKIESKIKPFKCYIGSAVNIASRKRDHLHGLRHKSHHNPKMQAHYNKYGESDLIFSTIIVCEKEDLLKHEQFFIDSLDPWFNICPIAGNILGVKRSKETCIKIGKSKIGHIPWNKGMKMTKEHCDNLRKSHKGQIAWNKGLTGFSKGKKISEEHKKRISEANTGNKNGMFGKHPSEESRKKKSESLKRTWNLKKLKIAS